MNLFQPVGQDLESYYQVRQAQPLQTLSADVSETLGVTQLQHIIKNEVGGARIKNENIQ